MPIVGSVFLLLLFYFLHWLAYLLIILLGFSSLTGVAFLIYPAFVYLLGHKLHVNREWKYGR